MKILGIGGSAHDFSYCILEDGKLQFSVEEERICREKHAIGSRAIRMKGIDYVLEQCGLDINDIDVIATNNICHTVSLSEKKYIHNIIKVNHHMAHIAASYYTSPFDEAALAVLDGCGDIIEKRDSAIGEIYSTGFARNNRIELSGSVYSPVEQYDKSSSLPCFVSSLGHFYMYMTSVCGFRYCQDGKTMGLAPYGKERFTDRIIRHMNYDTHNFMNEDIVREIQAILHETRNDELFQRRADLAYTAQQILQAHTFRLLNDLYSAHPSKNLCMSGGVMLNSAMNGLIKQNTPFEQVYIYPAAGDAGTALGAALYVHHLMGGSKRVNITPDIVYSGSGYSESEIIRELEQYSKKITWEVVPEEELLNHTAARIADGDICGWFQGRSEMGPRALGNRSILADPRNKDMKDRINRTVKFREDFRPFAPSVLQEAVYDFFDTDYEENPFMLYVGKVKEGVGTLIPAVTHVDGSSRLQTVSRSLNPRYHALIRSFGELTGIPVLLNTSFNIQGKPIVETPSQAVDAFLNSEINFLVMGNICVEKV